MRRGAMLHGVGTNRDVGKGAAVIVWVEREEDAPLPTRILGCSCWAF